MYDVNNHPRQEEVNDKIASILSDTIKKLSDLSKEENVEASSLAEQFRDCFEMMMCRYI